MAPRAPVRALFLIAALAAAASMWFYVDQILVGYQVIDAAEHGRPRGNLSDLYPRWLGARELLRHHRNPYGNDITLESQRGFYGRVIDPAKPNDPKDQEGFAYPVYVVFLLAPVIDLEFHKVQIVFHWLLLSLTVASVLLWLKGLQLRLSALGVAVASILMLGSAPAVQGIKLQQLSLLAATMLAGSVACLAGGFLFLGGVLLALATIKPQLAWPLVAWLVLWALSDWRARRRLLFGFGLTMALLLAGAEIILPGWWRMFAEAIGKYHQYTQNKSVLEVMVNGLFGSVAGEMVGRVGGQTLAAIAILACVPVLWKRRRDPADTSAFSAATALALALTVLVIPMYGPYNQVLLLPPILLLILEWRGFASHSQSRRVAYGIGALLLGWQWIASIGLTLIYLLASRAWALEGWKWPFFATFALPVWVFALVLFRAQQEPHRAGPAQS